MTFLPKIGAHAGWLLDFFVEFKHDPRDPRPFQLPQPILRISSSDYYASIEAQMPHGLDGGHYNFVVEGLTNEDYAQLYSAARSSSDGTGKSLCVNLHLYWVDNAALGSFVDLTGLADTPRGQDVPKDPVAVLRVTTLKRQAGSRSYEVVVEARERVYEKLLENVDEGGLRDEPMHAAAAVVDNRGVESQPSLFSIETGGKTEAGKVFYAEASWKAGDSAIEILKRLEPAMEKQQKQRGKNRFGLGMYLIRDGKLKMGPDRIPSPGFDPFHEVTVLTPEEGLIEVESREQVTEDPGREGSAKRESFELTLRGRPDIKPGDVVQFPKPPEETDDAGTPVNFTLGVMDIIKPGADTWMYVRGVTHRFSRERGFVTALRGVQVPIRRPSEEFWFKREVPKASEATEEPRSSDSSPDGFLAGVLKTLFGKNHAPMDVAQVRAAHVREADIPSQTERVRRGLGEHDGNRYAATRLVFDEGGTLFHAAPYATPFAWGKFGLVLPRYPGMRVLLAHRGGDLDDPVDVGALWESGAAPESEPGDYWLILPTEIVTTDRESVDDEQKPKEPEGKATNDLIDADGNRVIEVGKFTVRVGAEKLKPGGTRPVVAEEHVSIEHASGSKIVIDQDGNIIIESKKKLDLVAEDDITFDSKKKVVVKVAEIMNVKAR